MLLENPLVAKPWVVEPSAHAQGAPVTARTGSGNAPRTHILGRVHVGHDEHELEPLGVLILIFVFAANRGQLRHAPKMSILDLPRLMLTAEMHQLRCRQHYSCQASY